MIDAILGAIMTLLYNMFAGIIFGLMDGIQAMFKTFAGTGEAGVGNVNITAGNSGQETDTGLIYYLFNTPLIKNVFLSILLLGIFLLIIFTVMAFIKNAYASKQKKWQEIIGNSIKGLANFVFLPVCCLLGVWLSNILLNAIDGATNLSGSTVMSKMVFVSSAYSANVFRNSNCDQYHYTIDEMDAAIQALVSDAGVQDQFKIKKYSKDDVEGAREYYANYVDKIFGASEKLSVYNTWSGVSDWYRINDVNIVVMVIGGIFVLYTLISLTFGMVKRMFVLLILYVISPGLCAMYPLDDGGAVKKWKDDFVKNTISAYGAVAGLNLYFSISPIIQQIKIGGGWMSQFMNATGLTTLVLTIAGLYVVKDLILMISNYIGAGNALADGASLAGNVKKRMGQGAKFIGNRVKNTAGAFVRAGSNWKHGGGFKGFMGSLGRSSLEGMNNASKATLGIDFKATKKEIITDAVEAGNKEAIEKSQRRSVHNIRKQMALHADDPTKGWDDDTAMKKAKAAGVEGTINQIIADRMNAKELKDQRKDSSYIPTIHTAESVAEFKKASKEAAEAQENARQAAGRLADELGLLAKQLGVSRSHLMHAGTTVGTTTIKSSEVVDRMKRKDRYTDAEIAAETNDARRKVMVATNSAIDEKSTRESDLRAALTEFGSAAKALAKLPQSEMFRQTIDGNAGSASISMKSEEIGEEIQKLKDNLKAPALSSALTDFMKGVKASSDALKESQADLMRTITGSWKINSKSGGKSK